MVRLATWLAIPLLLWTTAAVLGKSAVSGAPSGTYVMLGRVLTARVDSAGWRGTRYTYTVRVLCAIPAGLVAGKSTTIVGYRTPPFTRSWPLHVAIMRPGTYFVLSPCGSGPVFGWGGNQYCPGICDLCHFEGILKALCVAEQTDCCNGQEVRPKRRMRQRGRP